MSRRDQDCVVWLCPVLGRHHLPEVRLQKAVPLHYPPPLQPNPQPVAPAKNDKPIWPTGQEGHCEEVHKP